MRAALAALVFALPAPAASQLRLTKFDLGAVTRIGQVILDATGPTSADYYLAGKVVHGELGASTAYWTVDRSGGDGSAAVVPPSRAPERTIEEAFGAGRVKTGSRPDHRGSRPTMRRLLLATCMAAAAPAAGQPFQGTAFMSPDVLTAADPSALSGVAYTGRGERLIFDFRKAYLFEARIADRVVEFQVNPEFESEEASREQVDVYAAVLGRLPAVLLSRLDNVHVNAGRPDHPDGI